MQYRTTGQIRTASVHGVYTLPTELSGQPKLFFFITPIIESIQLNLTFKNARYNQNVRSFKP